MPSFVQARRALAAAAIAAAAVLASCAEPPPVITPPPAPPPVALSPKLIEQAAAYRRYVQTASAISPTFGDGEAVAQGVRTGAAYEPQQLLRGAIAYGAVVALQDPGFVAGVQTYAADPTQRRTIAYEIMKDPAYVIGIQGSAGAAGMVMNALGEDGRKLLAQGKAVRQAAYEVQRAAWSKKDVAGRDARLTLAKQLSATPVLGEADETARLHQAVSQRGALGLTGQSAAPPYTPVVIRSMAVAALATLGFAEDGSLEQVMPILADPNATSCLNMSKLNLYQCLAVAKPHYEDVFCLGVHSLMDTGRCVMKSAGVPEPVETPTKLTAAPAAVTPVNATR
ncbi:hypothetical protein LRS10_02950 [Phenylobacterium sp. J426]|uniref:hypothetical protein n=1 Tax=Phenylobacterium sp. J426 TaxID=2898439 RepID=UPI002150F856|nr:hypothetical protein [Phenylobacterium sp. J426]MCR5873241.1 hypothetical protein [Phenylobacterium sp. J426]